MKRALIVLLVCVLPVMLFADPDSHRFGRDFSDILSRDAGPYLKDEIQQIQSDLGTRKLGDLDVAGLAALRDRLSIASQKDAYVTKLGWHSFALPGLGQFETGHTASGLGFLGLHLATIAGTLVAAYFTLPDDLRFDELDYFDDSIQTVHDTWKAHSFRDYLPSAAVFLGGMILDVAVVRSWSARNARQDAKAAVDNGTVQFTPRVGIGFMGFGLAY